MRSGGPAGCAPSPPRPPFAIELRLVPLVYYFYYYYYYYYY